MAKSKVIDKDRGYKDLLKRIPEIKGAGVKIGVTAGIGKDQKKVKVKGKRKSGTSDKTLVEIAWYNEYGTTRTTKGGAKVPHVPARPVIGPTADAQRGKVGRMMVKLGGEIIDRKQTVKSTLAIVGEFMQKKIQSRIRALKEPPNAKSTKDRKGSSNPLIATGQYRQSIRYEVNVPKLGISEEGGG